MLRRFTCLGLILILVVLSGLIATAVAVINDNGQRVAARLTARDLDSPAVGSGMARQLDAATITTAIAAPVTATAGPLRVDATNPRYFADANGNLVYLAGSHTWQNRQDAALTDPPPAFDYAEWLDFIQAHDHNFFRLWAWEQTWRMVVLSEPFYFTPHPYQRTGPETALDGKPKFDLTKFNQAYFDRLRQRVIAAQERGIYVSIMLFDGWSVAYPKGPNNAGNPWLGHPFNVNNNINGVNGDPNGDSSGSETHTLAVPIVREIQEAYVKKVIDTVNDLDNVLYEISNESDVGSAAWQYHMIDFIKDYEATQPNQHPVGMTVEWPNGSNTVLFDSEADWVSLNGDINNPPVATGAKVIIADTDHLCGICGDRKWVWKSFTRGENPLFMDVYDSQNDLEGGGYDRNNPNDVSLRRNLGYTRSYANRINLVAMVPRPDLASTGYCLANAVAEGAEYLVYLPDGGSVNVDLSATAGEVNVEWFNPGTGATTPGAAVAGGAWRSFNAPFNGDAVLYLYQVVETPTHALHLATVGSGSAAAQPAGPYASGQVITLTATAESGWEFAGWSGGINSSQNPTAFTITAATTVTATFTAEPGSPYTLDVAIVGSGGVSRAPDQATYAAGQTVTLTAEPATGWQFAGWSGGVTGDDNPKDVTITAATTVTATFTAEPGATHRLFVPTVGGGSVEVDPAGPYPSGQEVKLTAIPAAGWQFASWSGDAGGIDNPRFVTIQDDMTVTATFVASSTSALTLMQEGDGHVVVEPLQASYTDGQAITLTAVPADGWTFVTWSGDVGGVENPKRLTLDADTQITATFGELLPNTYELVVRTVGHGSVDVEPRGPYVSAQAVALTALPADGWQFSAWSGGVGGADNPIGLTITANTTVTATFTVRPLPKHVLYLSDISWDSSATQGGALSKPVVTIIVQDATATPPR